MCCRQQYYCGGIDFFFSYVDLRYCLECFSNTLYFFFVCSHVTGDVVLLKNVKVHYPGKLSETKKLLHQFGEKISIGFHGLTEQSLLKEEILLPSHLDSENNHLLCQLNAKEEGLIIQRMNTKCSIDCSILFLHNFCLLIQIL